MSDLKQMIKNKLEDDRGLANKLATLAGFKNPTPLYKFLNEYDREMENFNSLLVIVRELFEGQEFELMSDYCITLDPSKKTARHALEYGSVNCLSLRDELIIQLSDKEISKESKQWASIYGLEKEAREFATVSTLHKLSNLKLEKQELYVYRMILQVYTAYSLKMFDYMFEVAEIVNQEVNNIKIDYVRESYKARIGVILCGVNVNKNNIEVARKIGFDTLEYSSTMRITAMTYLNLGNSYIFESYDKSYELLSSCMKIGIECNKNAEKQSKRSLTFLQNVWGKEPEYINYDSTEVEDQHEIVFSKINKNEIEEAKVILNNIDINKLNNHQKAFNSYLRWRVTGDKHDLFNSVKCFKASGDAFFINLSLMELSKIGIDSSLVDLIAM